MMSGLKKCVKEGYILAKAVRLACIAQPDNIESYGLAENINVDDVISSFILKACLFGEHATHEDILKCVSPVQVSILLYERLIKQLQDKVVYSPYTGESPVDCTKCVIERGCCKRRRLMLEMCKNIQRWITTNTSELNGMDFHLNGSP